MEGIRQQAQPIFIRRGDDSELIDSRFRQHWHQRHTIRIMGIMDMGIYDPAFS
jgi:hypothetical protein